MKAAETKKKIKYILYSGADLSQFVTFSNYHDFLDNSKGCPNFNINFLHFDCYWLVVDIIHKQTGRLGVARSKLFCYYTTPITTREVLIWRFNIFINLAAI